MSVLDDPLVLPVGAVSFVRSTSSLFGAEIVSQPQLTGPGSALVDPGALEGDLLLAERGEPAAPAAGLGARD